MIFTSKLFVFLKLNEIVALALLFRKPVVLMGVGANGRSLADPLVLIEDMVEIPWVTWPVPCGERLASVGPFTILSLSDWACTKETWPDKTKTISKTMILVKEPKFFRVNFGCIIKVLDKLIKAVMMECQSLTCRNYSPSM
jgi:hypothetical protein